MNAASSGGTSASIVRSSSCSSRCTVPRCGSHRSFLSGLKIANSCEYCSCSLWGGVESSQCVPCTAHGERRRTSGTALA